MNDGGDIPVNDPVRVEVTRGGRVESAHEVDVVVVDAEDAVVLSAGRLDPAVFVRSAIKPFQALPLVTDGVADAYDFTDAELALCCGSHSGEPEHAAAARSILDRIGMEEAALACGPHDPFSGEATRRIWAEGREPGRIHNNCSGKHAGMLALARTHGWPTEGYHRAGHPVQQRILEEVTRWTGLDRSQIDTGVDGCGVVSFALPLPALAGALARLGESAMAEPTSPAGRVVGAMVRHPFMVGGTKRLCTAVMTATEGRVLAKVGAEGVYGAAVPDRSWGLALKARDGARRAAEAALVAVLDRLGVLETADAGALDPWRHRDVTNTLGERVGTVESGWRRSVPGEPERPAERLDERTRALVRLAASLAVDDVAQSEAMDVAAAVAPEQAEEVLLQSYLFLGFPVALNALGLWRRRTGRPAPSARAWDPEGWAERGVAVCRAVYAGQYEALREVMAGVHPDLDRWALVEGYGKVLGRPGLDLPTRELCVGAMLAGINASRQLYAHLRGCLNVGVAPAGVAGMLNEVEPILGDARLDAARRVWKRVLDRWESRKEREDVRR